MRSCSTTSQPIGRSTSMRSWRMSIGTRWSSALKLCTLRLKLGDTRQQLRRLDEQIDGSLPVEFPPSGSDAGNRCLQRLQQNRVHQLAIEESLPQQPDEDAAVFAIELERDNGAEELHDEEERVHESDHVERVHRLRQRLPITAQRAAP